MGETTTPKAINNLPEHNDFFTGRGEVLAQLFDLFKLNKEVTIKQAIAGLGGMGKTQIAIEFCYRRINNYQAILWVRSENEDDFNNSYLEVATLLELVEIANPQGLKNDVMVALVRKWLANNSNWLLILDNLEDPSLIKKYLPNNYQGHILITTQAHNLGQFASTIILDKMDSFIGSWFLLRRSGLLPENDSFDNASENNKKVAEEIVIEMDGLPLALDQTGAYIQNTNSTLDRYLALYKEAKNAVKLRDRRGKYTDEHLSVTATFSLAFDKVKEKSHVAAKLLQVCSFLSPDLIPEEIFTKAGNFLGDEINTLVGDSLAWDEVLEILLSYSLIKRKANNQTLSSHRLVQAVILDLIDNNTRQSLGENLVKTLSTLLPEDPTDHTDWHLYGRLAPSVLTLFTLANNKTISFSSIEAANLFDLTGIYYDQQGLFDEALKLFFLSLNIRKEIFPDNPSNFAHCLINIGLTYSNQAKHAKALDYFQQVFSIYERYESTSSDAQLQIAACQTNIGNVYKDQNKYLEALTYYNKALSTYKKYNLFFNNLQYEIAACLNSIGEVYRNLEDYTEALNNFQEALFIKESIYGKNHLEAATILGNISIVYSEQSNYPQALDYAERAFSIRKQALSEDHIDIVHSLENFASVYSGQGNYLEALKYYQQAFSIRQKAFGDSHPGTANSVGNIASIYANQAQYDKALYYYQKVLLINKEVFGDNHSNTATALNNIGTIYAKQGKFEQALDYYKQALSMRRLIFGEDNHSDIAASLNHIGNIYCQQDNYSQALDYFSQALSINQQAFGTNDPHIADTLGNIAGTYFQKGEYDAALQTYEQILSTYKQVFGNNHLKVANTLQNLASTYASQNKYQEAEDFFLKSLKTKESILGREHPEMANTLQNLGLLYQHTNRQAEAINCYKEALTIYDLFLPVNHPIIIKLLHEYSDILLKLDRIDEAQVLLDRLTLLSRSE